jgi:uncharacterized protein YegL
MHNPLHPYYTPGLVGCSHTILDPWFTPQPTVHSRIVVTPPPAHVQAVLDKPLEEFVRQRDERAYGNPVTHAGLLLDESWSMNKHKAAALEGFNAQVHVIKQGAQGAGKTLVSLSLFNGVARNVLSAVDVSVLRPLSSNEYRPGGGTALYDALGDMIAMFLAQPGVNDPNTAFLVSGFTDGEENSSTRYSADVLKRLVTRLEATGRWTFTLMAPQGEAEELAQSLNLHAGNVAVFDPSRRESVQEAFSAMTVASNAYMNMRSNGAMACSNFYSSATDAR